jgi:hypothetical protein
VTPSQALPTLDADFNLLLLPALAGAAAVAAAASAAAAAAASARIDYATTARLEAVTKPGGFRAALLITQPDKAATRALFLLPDRVGQATVVAPGLDPAWWVKAGAQAGVAVTTVGSLEELASLRASSFDVALVRGGVLAALSSADPSGRARASVLASVARALLPGGAAVMVERLAGGGPVAGAVRAWGGGGSGLAEADLEVLLESVSGAQGEASSPASANRGGKPKPSDTKPALFSRVAVDTVAGGADPHALVVATVAPPRAGGSSSQGGAPPHADEVSLESAVEARVVAGRRKGGSGGSGGGKKKGFSA